jgi:predicted membrane protein
VDKWVSIYYAKFYFLYDPSGFNKEDRRQLVMLWGVCLMVARIVSAIGLRKLKVIQEGIRDQADAVQFKFPCLE